MNNNEKIIMFGFLALIFIGVIFLFWHQLEFAKNFKRSCAAMQASMLTNANTIIDETAQPQ